jgi:hypothetical protein
VVQAAPVSVGGGFAMGNSGLWDKPQAAFEHLCTGILFDIKINQIA